MLDELPEDEPELDEDPLGYVFELVEPDELFPEVPNKSLNTFPLLEFVFVFEGVVYVLFLL